MQKKILAQEGIRVPVFAEFRPGEEPGCPSELRFPLIVKPLLEDASVGIAQASVVNDDEELAARARFIHDMFHQAAIVDEPRPRPRSEEHTSALQSHLNIVCHFLVEITNYRFACIV